MKGVVLAGGTGSRLFPLTKVTNKHLLPVGHYPMIFHPIAKLAEAGIEDILIVTGTDHMGDVVGVLGSGADLGVEFTFKVQDRAGGIAEALGLARGFVDGDRCAVILGDNIFSDSIEEDATAFSERFSSAHLLLAQVPDPERFGVAEVNSGELVKITEKPIAASSPYAVAGIYLYDSSVFDIIDGLHPSNRGELEITDVNNVYISNRSATYRILDGWWTDAGTFESLATANRLASKHELTLFESGENHRPQASRPTS